MTSDATISSATSHHQRRSPSVSREPASTSGEVGLVGLATSFPTAHPPSSDGGGRYHHAGIMLAAPTLAGPTIKREPKVGSRHMSPYPIISTRVIGQTEKTLGAILTRGVARSSLTPPHWGILTLSRGNGARV